MVNEASTMEPASNGGGGGGGDDGVKEASVVVTQLVLEQGGDQGVQLRSSARVSKKLKLDSQAATAAVTVKKVGDIDEKPSSQQTSPVSSVGSGVGSVQNASVGVSAAAANAPTAAIVAAEPARGRGRRGNETSLWSMDDKNAFFESLNEFGKDFDAIHHHIEMKARKRGEQEPKSRDQVRHFYYRTWNKISKHLTFPEGTTKMTQELYGLVNYGEMRKKIGYPYTAKNSHKLKELIFLGSTQIRIKGKTWRIKTPICKALRKLNALEDCCEEVLPPRVTVELRPRDNASWARVQSLAFNPRIVAELSLHRRLRSLIAHLQSRWRHTDDKLRQTVAGGDGGPSVNNHSTTTTSQCLAESGIHPLPDLPLTTDPIDLPDLCSSLPPTTQPPLSETPPTIITSLSNLQSNNFSNSVTSNSVSSSSIPSISQPISCLTLSSDHHSSSFASQSPSSSSSFEHPSSSQTLSSCSSSSPKPSSFYFSSVTSSSFTTTSSFSSSPSSSLPPSSSSLPPSSSSQQSSISSSSQLPSCSSSSITSSSLSLAAQLFPAPCDDTMELCVAPQQGTHMTDASFKVSAIATSAKLSFLSFTDRQGKDKSHILAELQAASKNSRQRAGALKRQRSDSSCEKGGVTRGGAADGELQADGMEQLDLQLAEHLPSLGCELLNNADQVLSDDGLGDTSPVKGGGVGDVGDLEPDDVGGCSHESVAETRARIATNLLKRVRHGWTAENADATCIGEVYVMFGSDSRLVLEYWWRKKGETLDPPPDAPRPEPPSTPVTTALQKLLSLAKLSYSKTRLTCPCGHVCNQPTPDTTNQVKSNQIIHQNPSTTGAVGNQAVSARSGGVNRVRGAPSKGEGGVQVPPQAASVPMDGVFRKPVLAPLRPKADTGDQFKFKAQLDKFKLLRFCNRRGRNSRSKNVVVPRILPLLPKVPADKQLMFKLRPAAPGGGVPGAVLNKEAVTGQQLLANQLITLTPTTVANFTMPLNSGQLFMPLQLSQPVGEPVPKAETVEVVDEIKEDESNGGPELLNGPKVISIEDEPPPSPMGLLKEEMLINTDDYSLSSLLGHLESPDKNCASAFGDDARHIADVTCDDSRLPDVDAQLESLMCEDSVDYMGKFADLAAKLTSDSLSHDTD